MIATDQVAVTDTPQLLITHPAANPYQVVSTGIMVNQGSTTIFVGGPEVTVDTGLRLVVGAGMSLENLVVGDLFVVAVATGEVDYLLQTSSA